MMEGEKILKNSFSKKERLCSKKDIKELFNEGSSFFLPPFKIISLYKNSSENCFLNQILISVPKRNFKKAVDRNNIKRLIRESYRLNKTLLSSVYNKKELSIAFIYIGKRKYNYHIIESKLKEALLSLNKQVEDLN